MDGFRSNTLALLVLMGACGAEERPPATPALDLEDAGAVAHAALAAYRQRDLAGLRDLALPQDREVYDELIRDGEASPRHKSIFGSWRWEAMKRWDGKRCEVRYSNNKAYAHFTELEEGKLVAAKLVRGDQGWRFEDLTKVSKSYFLGLSDG